MTILTEQQLMRQVPAIFAEQPHAHVSERYGFVPTIEVIEALSQEGWYPVHARQTQSRDFERRAVARHMIRFRQDRDRQICVGDSVTELVLTNSHDRTAAYQLDLGLFRLICLNGMVTPIGDMGGIRVRHDKDVVAEIINGSLSLVEALPSVAEAVDTFQSIVVDRAESLLFAETSLAIRYGEQWETLSPVTPEALLQARRSEDRLPTLWSVFNRTQENLFKGGLRGRSANGRALRTRPIKSVSEDVRLNRALWKLTEQFAELKGQSLKTAPPALRHEATDGTPS